MKDDVNDDGRGAVFNPRLFCPYEEVYRNFRWVAEEATRRFKEYHEIPLLIGAANAESAVRSIRTAMRYVPKEQRPSVLHFLMSQMLEDILKGAKGIRGRIAIEATKEKKARKKKGAR